MLAQIDVTNVDDQTFREFSEEEREFYLLSVYAGAITKNALSHEYHYRLGSIFEQAIAKGFGSDLQDLTFLSPKYDTIVAIRRHVYVFSAAKQYQQVRQMAAFISETATFQEFAKEAGKVFDVFNKNYLRTEFNTAVGQCLSARDWVEFEMTKEDFPYLTYRTQKDARVRDEHAILDGVTRPVDDPFWNTYMPKNGWNCRCFVTKHIKKHVTEVPDSPELQDEKKFPPVFRMNPGKDGLIFDPKHHPYFKVARGDAQLRDNNFNLPIP
jgi:SPP1 gp7 family putative phage head morphogenesis protein